ncbi:MAG: hypothetical protein IT198_17295 [Acidimicrobiia bacterium]|nr:hypothetical protein [Acidimicrobiia bacterium]
MRPGRLLLRGAGVLAAALAVVAVGPGPLGPAPALAQVEDCKVTGERPEALQKTIKIKASDYQKLVETGNLDALENPSSVLDGSIGTVDGRCSLTKYDIGYDSGAWNEVDRKIYGILTQFFFGITRWIVGIGAAIIRWAYGFDIAGLLAKPVLDLYTAFRDDVSTPLDLAGIALFATAVAAAWYLLRGRLGRAFGELGLSFLVYLVLTGFVIANPVGFVTGALGEVGSISAGIAETACRSSGDAEQCPQQDTAAAQPETGTEQVAGPLVAKLEDSLVVDSYDLLNWGTLIPADHPCFDRKEAIVATGPWGELDGPRDYMGEQAECAGLAAFNHEPSIDRLMGAMFLIPVTAVIVVLLVLVALTIITSQAVAVGMVVILPFAGPMGMLPGRSRSGLWRLVSVFLAALLTIVAMSVVLSGLLIALGALNELTAGRSLFLRSMALLAVVLAAFMLRKRILKGFQAAGRSVASRLGQVQPGGGSGWPALAGGGAGIGAGGVTGFGIRRALAEDREEVAGAVRPATRFVKRNFTETYRHGDGAAAVRRGMRGTGRPGQTATRRAQGSMPGAGSASAERGMLRRAAERVGVEVSGSRAGSAARAGGRAARGVGRAAVAATRLAVTPHVAVAGTAGKTAAKLAARKAAARAAARRMQAGVRRTTDQIRDPRTSSRDQFRRARADQTRRERRRQVERDERRDARRHERRRR